MSAEPSSTTVAAAVPTPSVAAAPDLDAEPKAAAAAEFTPVTAARAVSPDMQGRGPMRELGDPLLSSKGFGKGRKSSDLPECQLWRYLDVERNRWISWQPQAYFEPREELTFEYEQVICGGHKQMLVYLQSKDLGVLIDMGEPSVMYHTSAPGYHNAKLVHKIPISPRSNKERSHLSQLALDILSGRHFEQPQPEGGVATARDSVGERVEGGSGSSANVSDAWIGATSAPPVLSRGDSAT